MHMFFTWSAKLSGERTGRVAAGCCRRGRAWPPRLPRQAADVTAAGAAGIAGAGERLGADHIWVPWVGEKDLVPGVLARNLRLVDAGALHGRSTPRPVAVRMGWRGALRVCWTGSSTTVRAGTGRGRHSKGRRPVESSPAGPG